MKRLLIFLVILVLALPACAPNTGPKQGLGTLLGAGTGALLGSKVGKGDGRLVAVAIGTLAGAMMGSEIGRSLDEADKLAMERNAQYSLEHTPTRETTTWRNPDSGNYGTMTPVETYKASDGRYCREYIQEIYVGGEKQNAYGKACRQPDGNWIIVN